MAKLSDDELKMFIGQIQKALEQDKLTLDDHNRARDMVKSMILGAKFTNRQDFTNYEALFKKVMSQVGDVEQLAKDIDEGDWAFGLEFCTQFVQTDANKDGFLSQVETISLLKYLVQYSNDKYGGSINLTDEEYTDLAVCMNKLSSHV